MLVRITVLEDHWIYWFKEI